MVSAPFATNNTVSKGTKLPENRTVIKKLSFALPQAGSLIFAYCGAIFALPESALFDFSNANSALPRESSLVTAVRFLNA